jgi:hypothetical protein
MRRCVIGARPPRSEVVFYHRRLLDDGERKPRVSVTEPGRPLNACSVAQHTRTQPQLATSSANSKRSQ